MWSKDSPFKRRKLQTEEERAHCLHWTWLILLSIFQSKRPLQKSSLKGVFPNQSFQKANAMKVIL